MLVVPQGRFLIGSPSDEAGRASDEGPVQEIAIDYEFAMSRFEITVAQYSRFVAATNRTAGGNCITDRRRPFDWVPDADTNFKNPGYIQSHDHPVVCVSWLDATAYARWLSEQTGKRYRLPSEVEWEYAARAGTQTAFYWGRDMENACDYMNGTDLITFRKYPQIEHIGCNDGALNTSPVGQYRPNAFGLFDMTGNVGEWTSSCSTDGYSSSLEDGRFPFGDCTKRMVRGGSWGTIPRQQRVAERMRYSPEDRDDSIGIRLIRELSQTAVASEIPARGTSNDEASPGDRAG